MNGPRKASELPEGHNLTVLSVEARRDLPVPAVNVHLDEEVALARQDESAMVVDPADPDAYPKFDGIYAPAVLTLAQHRRCGLCTKPMAVAAFIGGQSTFDRGEWGDPPMHGECALAALTLCPHLRMSRHRRTSESRNLEKAGEIVIEARGERMFLVLAKSYSINLSPVSIIFSVAHEDRVGVETYRYVNGEIERESSMGLRVDQLPEHL